MKRKKTKKTPSPFARRLRAILQKIAIFLLALFCVAVFYLAVILGEPPADAGTTPAASLYIPEGPIAPSVERPTGDMNKALSEYEDYFPAPILYIPLTEGIAFRQGNLYEVAHNNGIARVIEMHYQVEGVGEVLLRSVYPASAYDLLGKQGLEIDMLAGALGKANAVRMRGEGFMRLHTEVHGALYALTAPIDDNKTLSDLGQRTAFTVVAVPENQEE